MMKPAAIVARDQSGDTDPMPMRLKVQQVFDATQTLAAIINEKRPLPQKGIYRVARMHRKLFTEFETINNERTAKITAYDHKNDAGDLAVPDDKMPEFVAWWNEMAGEEIEVDVEPIPIDQLCIPGTEGSITFAEFTILGDLVRDD